MEIRRMTLADAQLALDWAAAEGWNPGRHDAASCVAADPDGGAWTQRWEGRAGQGGAHLDVVPVGVRDVLDLDVRAFGASRETFLTGWLGQPEAVAHGLWRDGELVAHGMRRHRRSGWKVGPLFATGFDAATTVLDALVADLDGPYWIDIPSAHPEATRLAAERQMQPVLRTSRMVRGTAPPRDASLIYGVTSLELG